MAALDGPRHLAPPVDHEAISCRPRKEPMRRLVAQCVQPSTLAAASAFGQALAEGVPAEAAKVIEQVRQAANSKNYPELRKWMVSEFIWSFGGDASADQAMARWKQEPAYLRNLARVTYLKCAYRKDGYVQCPARTGTAFRAGFKQAGGTWQMEYFVEGD